MRGKRSKELRKFGIDKDFYRYGIRIDKIPQKYTTLKDSVRNSFNKLSPIERLIYAAYQINTLREIGTVLKKSHETVRRIYKRAYRKLYPK